MDLSLKIQRQIYRNYSYFLVKMSEEDWPFHAFKKSHQFIDDNFFTATSTEQKRVEDLVWEEVEFLMPKDGRTTWKTPFLNRHRHVDYCMKEIYKGYTSLDASRPWILYWGVHSLNLLGHTLPHSLKDTIIKFLKACEAPEGGYGGGPGQMPHLAPTYAAILTLASLQTVDALSSINRAKLADFLRSVHQSDGSYIMHIGGETDIRGAYCALSVASLCRIVDEKMTENTAEWLISCQTYEGGFGGEPGTEAHGGYTFCGLAALTLLDKARLCDMDSLLKWLVNKQMRYEGGFCGRSNKLVDGCYSFWQAAIFKLIEVELRRENKPSLGGAFDHRALEEYILVACQDNLGGMRDKPDKYRDLYHTCYVLSGLSIAQSYVEDKKELIGGEESAVHSIHPVLNITPLSEQFAISFFDDAATA